MQLLKHLRKIHQSTQGADQTIRTAATTTGIEWWTPNPEIFTRETPQDADQKFDDEVVQRPAARPKVEKSPKPRVYNDPVRRPVYQHTPPESSLGKPSFIRQRNSRRVTGRLEAYNYLRNPSYLRSSSSEEWDSDDDSPNETLPEDEQAYDQGGGQNKKHEYLSSSLRSSASSCYRRSLETSNSTTDSFNESPTRSSSDDSKSRVTPELILDWMANTIRTPLGCGGRVTTKRPTTAVDWDFESFQMQIQQGALLCDIVCRLESTTVPGIERTKTTRGACMANLNRALNVLRRTKTVNMSSRYLYNVDDLQRGDPDVIWGLASDIYKAYKPISHRFAIKPVSKRSPKKVTQHQEALCSRPRVGKVTRVPANKIGTGSTTIPSPSPPPASSSPPKPSKSVSDPCGNTKCGPSIQNSEGQISRETVVSSTSENPTRNLKDPASSLACPCTTTAVPVEQISRSSACSLDQSLARLNARLAQRGFDRRGAHTRTSDLLEQNAVPSTERRATERWLTALGVHPLSNLRDLGVKISRVPHSITSDDRLDWRSGYGGVGAGLETDRQSASYNDHQPPLLEDSFLNGPCTQPQHMNFANVDLFMNFRFLRSSSNLSYPPQCFRGHYRKIGEHC